VEDVDEAVVNRKMRYLNKIGDGLGVLWLSCMIMPGTNWWILILTFPLWLTAWLLFLAWMAVTLPYFAIHNKLTTGQFTGKYPD